jgi:hypothetical protein
MDDALKSVVELVAQVGVPGAILILGVWKLAPVSVKLLEILTEIKDGIVEMREEIRELPNRLLPRGA